MKNIRLKIILTIAAIILLVPFIAMQLTSEVNWDPFDFAIAGILLLGTGLIIELTLRVAKTTMYRIVAIISILIVFLLVWIELAVGIFGTPFAGN